MVTFEFETEFRRYVSEGQHHGAATLLLSTYGDELFGFLVHHLHDQDAAGEVFSELTEDVWRGLPSFRLECSARTWLYLLARNASVRFRRSPWQGRRVGDEGLRSIADLVRSRTPPWLRSDVKEELRALREKLDPDDRSLLALRIDRDLSWLDVARVFLGAADASADDLARESARLRKRMQFLKEELTRLARERGVLDV